MLHMLCADPPLLQTTNHHHLLLQTLAGEVITRLGEQLEEAGMQDVFAIPRARMPVVKFVHAATGMRLVHPAVQQGQHSSF